MANNVVENCPQTFKDWASRATLKCSNENTYHCVKDEFSSIVEVCTTPLWIQKGISLEMIFPLKFIYMEIYAIFDIIGMQISYN